MYLCKFTRDTNVWLIDTPGFDDTDRNERDVLEMVADFFGTVYNTADGLVGGVIYLHSITNPRLTGSLMRNLAILKRLCGGASMSAITLVTNLWEQVDGEVGVKREKALMENDSLWKPMIDQGSVVRRLYNNGASAVSLVESVLQRAPATARIARPPSRAEY